MRLVRNGSRPFVLPRLESRLAWRCHILGSALVLGAVLSACTETDDEEHFEVRLQNSPPTQAAIGERWRYEPDVNGLVVVLDIVQGPPGMFVGLSGDLDALWTPTLADLGQHEVILDITGDTTIPGTVLHETDTARLRFTLRVHQDLDLGTTLSPRGHSLLSTAGDLADYLQDREHGRVVGFQGPWRASLVTAGEVPQHALAAIEARRDFGIVPAIDLCWSDDAGTPDLTSDSSAENSWLNAETRQEFLAMVTALATHAQPRHLVLGHETNVYFGSHTQAEWDAWISELEACTDAIHAVSPGTQVATSFQLEFLMGLGANAGWSGPARWELVDDLEAGGTLDALAFTTYPYLEYDALADVPAAHWSEIAAHWSGPVLFTELAWPAAPHAPYPGDELEQADFVSFFLDGVAELEVESASWLFLHDWDQEAASPVIATTGLRDNLGLVLRPADLIWRAEVALRQRP